MSKFEKTIRSEEYWILKGQGDIYKMLSENLSERGDSAKLAERMRVTPGYISQIMNGDSEINPTWKKMVKMCLALDKVPVLQIMDVDKFLEEQNFNTFKQFASKFKLESEANLSSSQNLIEMGMAFSILETISKKRAVLNPDDLETLTFIPEEDHYQLL